MLILYIIFSMFIGLFVYEFDWLLVVLSPIILPIDFIMGVIRGKHD